MGEDFSWNDRYAGDDAWTEWFDICSVAGCRPEFAARLAEQVSSAMYAHLSRAGLSRADALGEDPVSFFDSYFRLKGSRDVKKPLKSYFRHRIREDGIDMVDFVCGTLFGSGSGRVRDIVLDWIAVLKGWKPRTVSLDDGSRRLVWENAGDADPRPSSFQAEAIASTSSTRSLSARRPARCSKRSRAGRASTSAQRRFSSTRLRTTSRSRSSACFPRSAPASRRPTHGGRR